MLLWGNIHKYEASILYSRPNLSTYLNSFHIFWEKNFYTYQSNIDLCVISKSKLDFLRPYLVPNKKGTRFGWYRSEKGTTTVLTEKVTTLETEVLEETVQTMDTSWMASVDGWLLLYKIGVRGDSGGAPLRPSFGSVCWMRPNKTWKPDWMAEVWRLCGFLATKAYWLAPPPFRLLIPPWESICVHTGVRAT